MPAHIPRKNAESDRRQKERQRGGAGGKTAVPMIGKAQRKTEQDGNESSEQLLQPVSVLDQTGEHQHHDQISDLRCIHIGENSNISQKKQPGKTQPPPLAVQDHIAAKQRRDKDTDDTGNTILMPDRREKIDVPIVISVRIDHGGTKTLKQRNESQDRPHHAEAVHIRVGVFAPEGQEQERGSIKQDGKQSFITALTDKQAGIWGRNGGDHGPQHIHKQDDLRDGDSDPSSFPHDSADLLSRPKHNADSNAVSRIKAGHHRENRKLGHRGVIVSITAEQQGKDRQYEEGIKLTAPLQERAVLPPAKRRVRAVEPQQARRLQGTIFHFFLLLSHRGSPCKAVME